MPKQLTKRIPSPLKWHGGKSYLASRIVDLFPPHVHYVEPFAGGLSVILAKSGDGISEVVNDLDSDLSTFWRVLREPTLFDQFRRRCEATPFGREVWEDAREILLANCFDWVERAWAFFVLCRQSHAGRCSNFAPLSKSRTRRAVNEQAAAWWSNVEGLGDVHRRLAPVVVENRRAGRLIEAEDSPSTLFYLDPPYVEETRTAPAVYAHEMRLGQEGEELKDEDTHWSILSQLAGIKGCFLLSGYRCDLYDRMAIACGWDRVDFDLPNNAAGGKEKRRMTESIWANFQLTS